MPNQNAVTIIVDINKGNLELLRKLLADIKDELQNRQHLEFETPGTIHYCRWIILEAAEFKGQQYMPQLAYSGNFDGEADAHLSELSAGDLGVFMDRIYNYCDGYPDAESRNPASRILFFKRFMIMPLAFYAGAPGRTVAEIKQESILRFYIRSFLDKKSWKNYSAKEVHLEIKKDLAENPDFAWLKTKLQLPEKNWPALILLGLVLIALLPVIIPWMLIVQLFHEDHDTPLGLSPSQIEEKRIKGLEDYEDLEFQNQFTQVLEMKPGMVRLVTLKAFMLIAKLLIKFFFVENNLMGIPTIHFAKWMLMNDDKRMLFVSNFDGSWQQYLGDFIDKSGWGLTAIWSNTIGFPKTAFLFFKGAYDEEHFLAWSRFYQIKTQVWYSAYPNLSIKNIVNNSHIRANVLNDLDEVAAKQFLQRF